MALRGEMEIIEANSACRVVKNLLSCAAYSSTAREQISTVIQ